MTIWPDSSGLVRGVLRFGLTLPRSAQSPERIRFGRVTYLIAPGAVTELAFPLDAPGAVRISFRAARGTLLQDLRQVSVQSSVPVFERAGARLQTQSRRLQTQSRSA